MRRPQIRSRSVECEITHTCLGEAARAATTDAVGKHKIVAIHVECGTSGQESDRAAGQIIHKATAKPQGASRQDEVPRVAADVVQIGDLKNAFVDGRLVGTATSRVGLVQDQGAPSGFGDVRVGGQWRRDGGRERGGGCSRGRIDHADYIFVCAADCNTAIEATENQGVRAGGSRGGVQGEEHRTAGHSKSLSRA